MAIFGGDKDFTDKISENFGNVRLLGTALYRVGVGSLSAGLRHQRSEGTGIERKHHSRTWLGAPSRQNRPNGALKGADHEQNLFYLQNE